MRREAPRVGRTSPPTPRPHVLPRLLPLLLLPLLGAGCAASSAQVRTARASAYQGSFDVIWARVVEAVGREYPRALLLDKAERRLVTCWRQVEKLDGGSAYFFRVTVVISPAAPHRVSVAGRVAAFKGNVFVPLRDGDFETPGWAAGRTDRIVLRIHEALAQHVVPAQGGAPPVQDSLKPETLSDTCVHRFGDSWVLPAAKEGIPIGAP